MPEICSSSSESPILALRDLLLSHTPPAHARMTEPGYNAKYLRVQTPITDADLAAHLAGDLTLACVFQRDDLAQVAACDIDTGGEAMVRRVMRAAETRACHAYGFVLDSGDHSGGHVWLFFKRPHPAHDLQILMRDIVTEAQCQTTEIYPNHADLRLPFGLHRRCRKRGTLLLNSAATPLDLDADLPGALTTFLEEVRRTSDLPVRVARETQEARRRAVMTAIASARPRRVDSDAHWREVIAQFNASTNLVSLLEGYGARAAYHYAGGKVLLHCAASEDHAHGDKHASLVVEMGRGHQAGRMICGCYCPACRLHNSPGQVMDAFEVYCRLERISKREAVSRLQRGEPIREAQSTPHSRTVAALSADADTATHTSAPTSPLTAPQLVPIAPDERLVQQRLVDVNADTRVQPLDRRLLAYLISHEEAGQGIANAALAAALGAQPDSIKRAKRRLRTLGYIEVTISRDGVHPSVIRVVGLPESVLPEDLRVVAERESTKAPPFHVESESTCDAQTREGESSNLGEEGAPSARERAGKGGRRSLDEQPVADLRRRQGVLRGLLRYGGTVRQQLAWHAEIGDIQAVLDRRISLPTTPAQQSELLGLEVSSTEPHTSLIPHLRLAHPEDQHLEVTDQQLTALLRDALEAQGSGGLRPLLGRVSWQLTSDRVMLVCAARDLQAVTAELGVASWLALTDILPEHSLSVEVRIGQPVPVELRPAWLAESLWVRVPQWVRPQLVGSVLVEGRLYGATSERTAGLSAHSEVVQWLLDQVSACQDDAGVNGPIHTEMLENRISKC